MNESFYQLRLAANPEDLAIAAPELLALKPRFMEIPYNSIQPKPIKKNLDYIGLYIQNSFYRSYVNGQYQEILSRHDFTYEWAEDGCLAQVQKVYYYRADGSFDPEPEEIKRFYITPEERNNVLIARRKKTLAKMLGSSQSIRNGKFKENSIDFFKAYYSQVENYKYAADPELIEAIATGEMAWMDEKLEDPALLAASGMSQEDIDAFPTVRQGLKMNFRRSLEIPTDAELESFLAMSDKDRDLHIIYLSAIEPVG